MMFLIILISLKDCDVGMIMFAEENFGMKSHTKNLNRDIICEGVK